MGVKVPADLRLVEVSDCRFDRSILTGESVPVSATTDKTDENLCVCSTLFLLCVGN